MTLEEARAEAAKLATRLAREVGIWEHVGGKVKDGSYVQPQGRYICYAALPDTPSPRYVWRLLELVPVPGSEAAIDQQAVLAALQTTFDEMTPEAVGEMAVAHLQQAGDLVADVPGLATVIAGAVTDQRAARVAAAAALLVDEPAPVPVAEPPTNG